MDNMLAIIGCFLIVLANMLAIVIVVVFEVRFINWMKLVSVM